jgi:hypothetical protein
MLLPKTNDRHHTGAEEGISRLNSLRKNTPVQFDEKPLRDMLASPYGDDCGHSILDSIESGTPVVIAMNDGRTVTLTDAAAALAILRDAFSWRPNQE